jgi:phosphoglycerate dehydrogenase-like enzyme
MKIVVTNNQDLTAAQKQRLDSLGDVTYYDPPPKDGAEYLERVKGADIICSGAAGLQDAYPQLKDVYITVAFVSVAFVDTDVLKKNNVTLSNAPGANRHAVAEWIMAMVLLLMRNLLDAINRKETYRKDGNFPPLTLGLVGSKITVLGQGSVGKRVGELATVFGMDVTYFRRGDNLEQSVKNADVVVDTLSSNPSTDKLLDEKFFGAMKQGSYFVTVTRAEVADEDAMLRALDSGKLAGAASDCGGILVGDTDHPLYQKLLNHPKVLVTPHVSYSTTMSMKMGADIMIDNVEAWIKGSPQNVVVGPEA